MSNVVYRLSDETLGCIVQSVQAALLTGLDISDLLRSIQLTVSSGDAAVLDPTPAYINSFNDTMDQMMERALQLEAEMTGACIDR